MAEPVWRQILEGTYDPFASSFNTQRSVSGMGGLEVDWRKFSASQDERRAQERARAEAERAALEAQGDEYVNLQNAQGRLERALGTAEALGQPGVEPEEPPTALEGVARVLDTAKSVVVGGLSGLLGWDIEAERPGDSTRTLGGRFRRQEDLIGNRSRIEAAWDRAMNALFYNRSYGFGDFGALRYEADETSRAARVALGGAAFILDTVFDPLTYYSFGSSIVGRLMASTGVRVATRSAGSEALKGAGEAVMRAEAAKLYRGELAARVAKETGEDLAELAIRDNDSLVEALFRTNKGAFEETALDGWSMGNAAAYGARGRTGLFDRLVGTVGEDAARKIFDDLPGDLAGGSRFRVPFRRTVSKETELRMPTVIRFPFSQPGRGFDVLGMGNVTRKMNEARLWARTGPAKFIEHVSGKYGQNWTRVLNAARQGDAEAVEAYSIFFSRMIYEKGEREFMRRFDHGVNMTMQSVSKMLKLDEVTDPQEALDWVAEAYFKRGRDDLPEILTPNHVIASDITEQFHAATDRSLEIAKEIHGEDYVRKLEDYATRMLTDEGFAEIEARMGLISKRGGRIAEGDSGRAYTSFPKKLQVDEKGRIVVEEWYTPQEIKKKWGRDLFVDDPVVAVGMYLEMMRRELKRDWALKTMQEMGILLPVGKDVITKPTFGRISSEAANRIARLRQIINKVEQGEAVEPADIARIRAFQTAQVEMRRVGELTEVDPGVFRSRDGIVEIRQSSQGRWLAYVNGEPIQRPLSPSQRPLELEPEPVAPKAEEPQPAGEPQIEAEWDPEKLGYYDRDGNRVAVSEIRASQPQLLGIGERAGRKAYLELPEFRAWLRNPSQENLEYVHKLLRARLHAHKLEPSLSADDYNRYVEQIVNLEDEFPWLRNMDYGDVAPKFVPPPPKGAAPFIPKQVFNEDGELLPNPAYLRQFDVDPDEAPANVAVDADAVPDAPSAITFEEIDGVYWAVLPDYSNARIVRTTERNYPFEVTIQSLRYGRYATLEQAQQAVRNRFTPEAERLALLPEPDDIELRFNSVTEDGGTVALYRYKDPVDDNSIYNAGASVRVERTVNAEGELYVIDVSHPLSRTLTWRRIGASSEQEAKQAISDALREFYSTSEFWYARGFYEARLMDVQFDRVGSRTFADVDTPIGNFSLTIDRGSERGALQVTISHKGNDVTSYEVSMPRAEAQRVMERDYFPTAYGRVFGESRVALANQASVGPETAADLSRILRPLSIEDFDRSAFDRLGVIDVPHPMPDGGFYRISRPEPDVYDVEHISRDFRGVSSWRTVAELLTNRDDAIAAAIRDSENVLKNSYGFDLDEIAPSGDFPDSILAALRSAANEGDEAYSAEVARVAAEIGRELDAAIKSGSGLEIARVMLKADELFFRDISQSGSSAFLEAFVRSIELSEIGGVYIAGANYPLTAGWISRARASMRQATNPGAPDVLPEQEPVGIFKTIADHFDEAKAAASRGERFGDLDYDIFRDALAADPELTFAVLARNLNSGVDRIDEDIRNLIIEAEYANIRRAVLREVHKSLENAVGIRRPVTPRAGANLIDREAPGTAAPPTAAPAQPKPRARLGPEENPQRIPPSSASVNTAFKNVIPDPDQTFEPFGMNARARRASWFYEGVQYVIERAERSAIRPQPGAAGRLQYDTYTIYRVNPGQQRQVVTSGVNYEEAVNATLRDSNEVFKARYPHLRNQALKVPQPSKIGARLVSAGNYEYTLPDGTILKVVRVRRELTKGKEIWAVQDSSGNVIGRFRTKDDAISALSGKPVRPIFEHPEGDRMGMLAREAIKTIEQAEKKIQKITTDALAGKASTAELEFVQQEIDQAINVLRNALEILSFDDPDTARRIVTEINGRPDVQQVLSEKIEGVAAVRPETPARAGVQGTLEGGAEVMPDIGFTDRYQAEFYANMRANKTRSPAARIIEDQVWETNRQELLDKLAQDVTWLEAGLDFDFMSRMPGEAVDTWIDRVTTFLRRIETETGGKPFDPERELVDRTRYVEALREAGYAPVTTAEGVRMNDTVVAIMQREKLYGPELLNDIIRKHFQAAADDDGAERFYRNFWRPYYTASKAWMTQGRGYGYTVRNIIGSMYNSWLMDVNARHFRESAALLAARVGAKEDADAVIVRVGAGKQGDIVELWDTTFYESLERRMQEGSLKVDRKTARRLVEGYRSFIENNYGGRSATSRTQGEILDRGSYGEGVFGTRELGRTPADLYPGQAVEDLAWWQRSLNATVDNAWMRHVTRLNEGVEDYLRFAAFLRGVDMYGLEDGGLAAGTIVRGSQFDYTDLSDFERRVLKNIIPFYTWTRYNVPLQVRSVWMEPGKINRLLRFHEEVVQAWTGEAEDQEQALPEWLRRRGGWMTTFTTPDADPESVLGRIFGQKEDPIAAFIESPLSDLGMLFNATLNPLQMMNTDEVINNLNPLVGRLPYELFTGQSYATGRELRADAEAPRWAIALGLARPDEEGVWRYNEKYGQTLRNLLPPLAQGERLFAPIMGDPRQRRRWLTSVGSNLLASPAYTVDPNQQAFAIGQYAQGISDALEAGTLDYEDKRDIIYRLLDRGFAPEEITRLGLGTLDEIAVEDFNFQELDRARSLQQTEDEMSAFLETVPESVAEQFVFDRGYRGRRREAAVEAWRNRGQIDQLGALALPQVDVAFERWFRMMSVGEQQRHVFRYGFGPYRGAEAVQRWMMQGGLPNRPPGMGSADFLG